jgi:hypothetical protein
MNKSRSNKEEEKKFRIRSKKFFFTYAQVPKIENIEKIFCEIILEKHFLI